MRYYILLLLLLPLSLYAQDDKSEVRKGNDLYQKGEYAEAEKMFRAALEKDSLSVAAAYDLAGALYQQEKYAEAAEFLNGLIERMPEHERIASFYHNLGNCQVQQKDYASAIESYKASLRRSPYDMDTKTNLAYAQKMLKDQQNQQDQNKDQQDQNKDQQDQNKDQQDQNKDQQDQNKDQQDQNKDQQDQNKDQQDQNKDQQDQNKDQQDQNKDQQDQNKDRQGQGESQGKISKQDAKQLLKAIGEKEQKTIDKVKKAKAQRMKNRKKEKNW